MADKAKVASDPAPLESILSDLLIVLAHGRDTTPAQPEAAEALRRLHAARHAMQRERGVEATPLAGPHGPVGAPIQEDE